MHLFCRLPSSTRYRLDIEDIFVCLSVCLQILSPVPNDVMDIRVLQVLGGLDSFVNGPREQISGMQDYGSSICNFWEKKITYYFPILPCTI